LIDQHRIDHAANLNQLLPLAAVACKPGDFPGSDRAYLPQTDLCDHALKSSTRHRPGGGSSQILSNHLDLTPP
jgi:hypothetical protein